MKTQAYVLAEKDAPFKLQDVELAEPEHNEVLLEVVACGLCHTDLCIQNGAFPSPFPNVTGHEGSGRVLKVGEAVTRVQPGDKVLCSFNHCSSCGPCRTGHPAACEKFGEINFGRVRSAQTGNKAGIKGTGGEEIYGAFFGQSMFARHALAAENSVVKVPDDTDLVTLSALGCGFQTGAGGVLNFLKPSKDSSIAISGLGAVGMGALFAAKYLGIKKIVALDVVPAKLDLAKKFGATHAFSARDSDVVQLVKDVTEYKGGVQYFVECSGNVSALKAAWAMTANRGHLLRCVVSSRHPGARPVGDDVDMLGRILTIESRSCGTPGPGVNPPFDVFGNLVACKTYSGLCEGDSNPPEFIPFLIKLYNEGHFPVDKISKIFAHDKLDDAIHAMHNGETIKPIVVFGQA
ncbi:hypothetical protein JCM10295v2_001421 [Rhodotorula toruloides]